MMEKARLIAAFTILIGAAAGAQLTLANSVPQRAPQPNGTTGRPNVVVRPGAGTVLSPTLTSVGLPLTQGECKNLGGTVQKEASCDTGLECTHVDSAGTIHRVCVTNTVN